MIRSAREMRAAARISLSGKWGGAVVMGLVYFVVYGVFPAGVDAFVYEHVGSVAQLLLLPLAYGMVVAYLDNVRSGEEYRVEQLFAGLITPVCSGRLC